MSPLDYLSGATGDPINLKRRVAQQAVRGVPATSGFVDFRSNGGPMALTPSEIERLVITGSGEPEANLAGKITLGGGPFEMGDLDPADAGLLNFLANVMKKYTHTTEGTGTYERWILSLDEATAAAAYLTMLNDNDVLPRTRAHDVVMGGFTLGATANNNLAIQFPFVAGDYDFFGIVTQEAGSASSLPLARKTWPGNWDTADKDIYLKVISVADIADPTDPRVTVQTKTGAAGTFANTQTIHLGRWNRIYDEANAMFGRRAEQVQIRWEVGATIVALDQFKIPQRRAAWAQALGPAYPISSINALVVADGEEIRTEGGWSLEVAWQELEAVPDVYGRQGYTVERRGHLNATLNITRRLVDLTFQKKLHEAEQIACVIDAVTDSNIPGATVPFRFLAVLPNLRPFGTMFDTGPGGTNREEPLTLRAGVPTSPYSYGGLSFTSHLNLLLENDIASLAG